MSLSTAVSLCPIKDTVFFLCFKKSRLSTHNSTTHIFSKVLLHSLGQVVQHLHNHAFVVARSVSMVGIEFAGVFAEDLQQVLHLSLYSSSEHHRSFVSVHRVYAQPKTLSTDGLLEEAGHTSNHTRTCDHNASSIDHNLC